jgi:hypothetical protein
MTHANQRNGFPCRCADCARELDRIRQAAKLIPLAWIRPPRLTWAEWDAACEVLWPTVDPLSTAQGEGPRQ